MTACDLAGEWLPIRAAEWKNRNIGSHAARARMPWTKVAYQANGTGEGWVGDVHVQYELMPLAPGHYSAKARIPALFWSANDGNLTVLGDGTLEARYPSNGIVEYWRRADGRTTVAAGAGRAMSTSSYGEERRIKVVFRRVDGLGIAWHWGLAVGDSIYEVGGSMAVIGPRGVVCATGPVVSDALNGTRLGQFDGYVEHIDAAGPRTSTCTDADIEAFATEWCHRHPTYNALGPNCQTFTEDLYIFLTGQNLGFAKFADLQRGPEASARAVWLR